MASQASRGSPERGLTPRLVLSVPGAVSEFTGSARYTENWIQQKEILSRPVYLIDRPQRDA